MHLNPVFQRQGDGLAQVVVEQFGRRVIGYARLGVGPNSAVLAPEEGDLVAASKLDSVAGADFSALTGQGLDNLVRAVGETLEHRASSVGTATRDRHRIAIARAKRSLEFAIERIKTGSEMTELAAEDVRSGVRALESVLGRVDVEDLLDEIFQSFCIGK